MEKFKKIKNYENYEISENGIIRRNNKILKPYLTGKGNKKYLTIALCKNGTIKKFKIHRLVAETFIPNPENKKTVNHIDGNKLNNCVNNLEWCTYSENNIHSYQKLNKIMKNKKGSIPIIQYDINGDFIKEYPSSREVQRQLHICHSDVISICKGIKSNSKYIFKFKKCQ